LQPIQICTGEYLRGPTHHDCLTRGKRSHEGIIHSVAPDIEADQEILKISRFATGRGMRLLTKDEPVTWWGGPNTLIPPRTSIRSSRQITYSSRASTELT
jgi:hypothetical protein